MASIKVNTNISAVVGNVIAKIKTASNPEYLLRPICLDIVDLMTKRIHIDGYASDGMAIGEYNKNYLSFRQKHHKRSSDPKIIVSLTRQLENDWSVIATPRGYGIGFLNNWNLKKARYVEKIKKKTIFSLSVSERQYVFEYANDLIKQALE